jgi:hypothetical protein
MAGAEPEHAELINTLRRDGALIVPVCDIGDVKAWRSGVRRACRKAGLRIRTGLTTNGEAIWVDHIDHVVTPAQMQAATRATADYLAGIPATPHDQLVRQEQRRLLTVVPDVEQPGDPEGSQAVAELRTSDQHAIPLDIDLRDVVIEYSSRQHTWHDEDERCVQE